MWAELELTESLFQKWNPHLAVVTSYFPRDTETTKQGKTAVCPRFVLNSLLARFLWKMAGAAHLLAAPPPLNLSRCTSWSFWDAPWLKASIFLERLLLWLPARPLVSREIFFSRRGARLILLSEGRDLLSLFPLEDPRLWASLATSPGPFQNIQFLTGKPGLG